MPQEEEITVTSNVTREQRNHEIITKVIHQTRQYLDPNQKLCLIKVLEKNLQNIAITKDEITIHTGTDNINNMTYLDMYINAKTIEGLSDRSIDQYYNYTRYLLEELDKPIEEITTDDIRYWLGEYEVVHECRKVTMDNIRRYVNGFFTWLEEEHYLSENPMKRISRIRHEKVVKKAFTDEEIARIRTTCQSKRDVALIEFLLSTGVRCTELSQLDIDDVDFEERSAIVRGKGAKEREVYFDAKTKLHLEEYLDSRDDEIPALFLCRRVARRMSKDTIGKVVRGLGEEAGVTDCHPHRFRRTMATNALDKGMPIEQVQRLLGHSNIETTMIYAMVKQENVKNSHRKYIR